MQVNLSSFKFVPSKKVIVPLIAALLVGEIAWFVWPLLKPVSPQSNITMDLQSSPASSSSGAVISLQTAKKSLKIGEKFAVDVNVSSKIATDGTDLIINYDPKLLTVVPNGAIRVPVLAAGIYDDYPVNKLEENLGKIVISGITSKAGGTIPNGLFGTINFEAKAAGLARIDMDFVPGQTTDSNVIESKTAKDILEKVNNLEVEIK